MILPILSTITCVWIEWCDRRNSVVVVYCLVCKFHEKNRRWLQRRQVLSHKCNSYCAIEQ